jgi:spermidine synthase
MTSKRAILTTAFLEGLSVLIIEIAGARAVAPYYGTSLKVWTSQITATLLFLALGYGLGGRLSKTERPWALPAVFWAAGVWLALFPYARVAVLKFSSLLPGVGLGSFAAGALLFGVPLLALGAVSPLLIQRLQRDGQGGAAAGGIFLTNTLGGLAGGWITALGLVPHLPLRVILAGTGLGLALLGTAWAWSLRGRRATAVGLPGLLLLLLMLAPRPAKTFSLGGGETTILHSQSSQVGLLQVMDMNGSAQSLLLDGITQGGMDSATGLTVYEFSEYLAYMSWRHHPRAKKALLLGLGTGMLAKQLAARGMEVQVVEIEPKMEAMARRYFGLPAGVTVTHADARQFLNQDGPGYDLIFLDAFAGENMPWYAITEEGLGRMKARLNPGGRVLVNLVTRFKGGTPALARVEAGLLKVFGNALVYVEDDQNRTHDLVNGCLVAGESLAINDGVGYPGKALPEVEHRTRNLVGQGRPAKATVPPATDDFSDVDFVDADLRLEWRKLVLSQIGPEVLGD